jgi:hypothetical protein
MTEKSYPWDGIVTGDAVLAPYDDDTWSDIWRKLFTKDRSLEGVIYGVLNNLLVSGATSPITVATGAAMVDGKVYDNDTAVTLIIPTPSIGTRIDFIVLRKRWATQTVRITRIAGVEGGGSPAITQLDGNIWDIPLAQVIITTAGAITIADFRSYLPGQGVTADSSFCDGRLTLTAGLPVTTAAVTNATKVYFAPYKGHLLALYNGAKWFAREFTEITLDIAALASNRLYDIFVFDNSGTHELEAVAWSAPPTAAITSITNASPRIVSTPSTTGIAAGELLTIAGNSEASNNASWRVGTVVLNTSIQLLNLDGTNSSAPGSAGNNGAWTKKFDIAMTRVTPLVLIDGVYVKSGSLTKRYLGTILIDEIAGKTHDAVTARYLWNYYNRVRRSAFLTDLAATAFNTSAWRIYNNDFANYLPFGVGVSDEEILFTMSVSTRNNGAVAALKWDLQTTVGTISPTYAFLVLSGVAAGNDYRTTQQWYKKVRPAGLSLAIPAQWSSSSTNLWYNLYAALIQNQ